MLASVTLFTVPLAVLGPYSGCCPKRFLANEYPAAHRELSRTTWWKDAGTVSAVNENLAREELETVRVRQLAASPRGTPFMLKTKGKLLQPVTKKSWEISHFRVLLGRIVVPVSMKFLSSQLYLSHLFVRNLDSSSYPVRSPLAGRSWSSWRRSG